MIRHRSAWVFGVLFFFVLSVGITPLVLANKSEAELEAERANNEAQLKNQKEQLELLKQDENTESYKLGEIEGRLGVVQKAYDGINNEVLALELKIFKITEDSKTAEILLGERRVVLAKRMRDIYKKGQISYLDVLLGASDFVDFATRLQVLQKVLSNDLNLINDVLGTQKKLVKMKKEVEETHKKQEVLRKEAELKRNEILEERNKQKAIYETIFRNKELQEKQVRELEQLDKKIEIALKMARGEVVGATGQYIRPTSGPVTSVYSKNRVHPVFGSVRPHNGTDFGGYYGEPIKAADGGEVTFSGWMSGYGYTVIINHGTGMATLYAHQNQSPPVSVGQTVEQAEVIGYVGSTGYSTGAHLHLEFRLNGELQDPYNYVPYY